MIPYALDHPYERTPYATLALIGVNAVMFPLIYLMKPEEFLPLLTHVGEFKPWQWLTSAFLHAGPEHLLGNMLFLWVYGRYVEERLGPWRAAALYGVFIVASEVCFILANFGLDVRGLGASGAISGLMGFVLVAAPTANVRCFWWGRLSYGTHFFSLPAWLLLGFWVIEQSVFGLAGLAPGVAISAHLGGFFAGMAAALLLRSRYAAGTDWHLPRHRTSLDARTESTLEAHALAALHRAQSARQPRDDPPAWHSRPVEFSRRRSRRPL